MVLKISYRDDVSYSVLDKGNLFRSSKKIKVDVYMEKKEGKISEHMNLSDFPSKHPLYYNNEKEKHETRKLVVSKVLNVKGVCFTSKCYSLFQDIRKCGKQQNMFLS